MIRALCLFLISSPVVALDCTNNIFSGASYTTCTVAVEQDRVELFLHDDSGQPFGQFVNLVEKQSERGLDVLFAMNAGMFHSDLRPVGHYVENYIEKKRVIANPGPGNFGMLPNGIFCINDQSYRIYETHDYIAKRPNCKFATQSGPLILNDGALHPRIKKGSTSQFIRNGVGVSQDGATAHFVISNQRVNFHQFTLFFRDELDVPDALYFDGNISRLYAPELGRSGVGWSVGPMVAALTATK